MKKSNMYIDAKYENYGYSNVVSNDVKSSLIEGEKISNKFRNRGLTRDKRATINSVLDNRTLIILKKLKDNLLNEIYGVVSSGKEAFVFNSHKYLNDEELNLIKEIILKRIDKKECRDSMKKPICKNKNSKNEQDKITDESEMYENEENEEEEDEECEEYKEENEEYEKWKEENYENEEYEDYKNEESEDYKNENENYENEKYKNHIPNNLYKINNIDNNSEKREVNELENIKLQSKSEETFDIINEMSKLNYKNIENNLDIFNKKKVAISFATKIYNTSILVFKKRSQYIEGEFRFRNAYTKNTNPRKMVKQWSEKEFRNLRRILICGLRCPYPLVLKSNVIVMSMLGNLDNACPKLKDLNLSTLKWKELYIECICILRLLFCNCKLVHADFSEYNLLYFYNHIYIIDVSQSMENDHPYSLEFLKRDCLNITNFFKKYISNIQNYESNNMQSNDTYIDDQKNYNNMEISNNSYANKISYDYLKSHTLNEKSDKYLNLINSSSEDFYDNIQILPLKHLFDYIVSSSLPQDVLYFLEKDKKKISLNYFEMIYLQIFGLLKNTTPIPKLNLKKIQKNRIYFEKLKRATCYYVTKFSAQKHLNQKNSDKEQIEEQIFLNSWIPSYLNEIKDIKTIEKDLKLLKKGKSLANNFILTSNDKTNNYHKENSYIENNCENTKKYNNEINENHLLRKIDLNEKNEELNSQSKQKPDIDNRELNEKEYERKNKEKNTTVLNGKNLSIPLEKNSDCDLSDSYKSSILSICNSCSENEQEQAKFKGIIPEGVTRKEWSKLVKEQNREKRKHKIPKYQKKKKKKKAHLKKKK
ncbi:serine/threonine protein kinase RIO1, putative [Plasmodium gallinaceum]|uniref:non-specific serine/threonine protein kinase n=1 Tax=Plasmodium gallinaceum TaxID=5849 RepID=A0A1J1H095_PLAGA|nr:serine/threonine protein kinase RIO1, putative [Plasmodium gallinaceum]CRG96946.1 serine/threonine protein kinase RIO1, putative [Plasmodium gallinaceum]